MYGSGGIVPHNLNFSARWRWVVRWMSWLLYPWWNAPCTHHVGGCVDPRASLDTVAEEKIVPFWESNPSCPVYSSVTILTYLPHVLKHMLTKPNFSSNLTK